MLMTADISKCRYKRFIGKEWICPIVEAKLEDDDTIADARNIVSGRLRQRYAIKEIVYRAGNCPKLINACGDSRLRGLRSRKPIGFRRWVVHKLIDKSVQFDSNKDLYTEESFQVFKKAYDEAVQVYQNEKATQEEVDQARVNLESGRWQLREKPDKDKLEELLAKIAKIDFSLYSKKTAKAVKAAYEMASVLMADETVTQLEIDKAVEQLESAMQILDEESLSGEIISDQEETLSGKVIASNKGDDGNKKETKPTKTAKTVKTGDMANPFALIMLAVMAGAVITAVSVKTKKQR